MGNFCVQGCQNIKDKCLPKKEKTSGEQKDENGIKDNLNEKHKKTESDSSSSDSDSEDSKKENKESKERKKKKKDKKHPQNTLSGSDDKKHKEKHDD